MFRPGRRIFICCARTGVTAKVEAGKQSLGNDLLRSAAASLSLRGVFAFTSDENAAYQSGRRSLSHEGKVRIW